jgi:hypothetical protein
MRRFIILPSIVAVVLLGCDGNTTQELAGPDPSFAKATAQEQIAALGCTASWLDYSAGPPPAPSPCPPGPPGDPCRAAWDACCRADWDDWFAANRHYDGFTVKGRSIYGTEHRDIIVCDPTADPSGKVMGVKLFGLEGDDSLLGGAGDDEISGGKGCDRVRGRDGDDLVDGGPGNDGTCQFQDLQRNPWRVLSSGCYGLDGDDVLLGGPGTDVLRGGPGIDECDGGPPGEFDDFGGDCEIVGG